MYCNYGHAPALYFVGPVTACPRLDTISAARTAQGVWIDPRNGKQSTAGEFPAAETPSSTTPRDWPDALLLIEAKGPAK